MYSLALMWDIFRLYVYLACAMFCLSCYLRWVEEKSWIHDMIFKLLGAFDELPLVTKLSCLILRPVKFMFKCFPAVYAHFANKKCGF